MKREKEWVEWDLIGYWFSHWGKVGKLGLDEAPA